MCMCGVVVCLFLVAEVVTVALKYLHVKKILMSCFMTWGYDGLFVSTLEKTQNNSEKTLGPVHRQPYIQQ